MWLLRASIFEGLKDLLMEPHETTCANLLAVQLLDWKEAGAFNPATLLLMAAGVVFCVYMLG